MGLRVQLLGDFAVWRDGVLLEEWDSEQTVSLLKILLSERGRVFLCEQLIEYLWPNYPDFDQAMSFLRARIHNLRRALEPTKETKSLYIQTQRNGYSFSAEADCSIDAEEFSTSLQRAHDLEKKREYTRALPEYEKALSLYRGEYLPEDRYEEWAAPERERYRHSYVSALLGTAECQARQGQYRRAVDFCRQALTVDKYSEDIYRQAMLYNYLMGNPGEALRVHQECEKVLSEGLEVKPSAPTRQLYEQIIVGRLLDLDSAYPTPTLMRHPIHHSLGRLPFVGRQQEYSRLLGVLESASKSHGAFVLIGGEAGAGKTRLIQETLHYAEQHLNANSLQGRCTELGAKQPYQALLQALSQYLDELDQKMLDQLPSFGLTVLAQWLPELAQRLGSSQPLPSLPPEKERLRFFESISQLLLQLAQARAPLVLFLDDLQWADPSTLEFLDYLALRIGESSLVILGTYRPDEIGSEHPLERLLRRAARESVEGQVYSLELAKLSEETVDELLRRTAPGIKDRERLSRYLQQKSGGNPFFLVAVLQSLFEAKAMSATPKGHWLADVEEILQTQVRLLPQEIQKVVGARIERLEKEDRQLLQAMSVLGPRCHSEILSRLWKKLVTSADQAELIECLTRLQQAQMILSDAQGYSFAHDILREVAYQKTGAAGRLMLHREVAEICEEFYRDEPQPPHGLLAHHYARAGAPRKALEHLLPALKNAVGGYRNTEGLELATEAWGLTEELAEQRSKLDFIQQAQFEILAQKIKIYDILARRIEQETALTELFDLVQKLRDESKPAQVHLMRAKLYLDTARYPQAHAESLKALKIATEQKNLATQGQALHSIVLIHYRTGAYSDALVYLRQEQELQKALGDEKNLAKTFHYLGMLSWRSGRYEEAEKHYQQALKLLEKINDRQGREDTLSDMGALYWDQNKYQQVVDTYDEVRRLAAEIGDRRAEANALSSLSSTHWALGDYEKALKLRQEAAEIHREIGEKRIYAWDLNSLGLIYWSLGSDELARQCFERVNQLASEIGWKDGQAFTLNNIGLLEWRANQLGSALGLNQKAAEIHRRSGNQRDLGIVLRNLGEIYRDAEEYPRALEHLDQALVISRALDSKLEEMQVLSDQSATYLKMNALDKALACSQNALEILKKTKRFPQAQQILFAHFQMLDAAGERREALKYLYKAHKALIRRAKRIQNPEFRESYLKNVPVHHEILDAHKRYLQKVELSDAACYALLRKLRWPNEITSPCCGSDQIRVHGQVSRSSEKRYVCMKCRKTFSDRTGMVFAHKNLPLSKLFQALVLISHATDEASAVQTLTRTLEVHARTATNIYQELSVALREDMLLQQLVQQLCKKLTS